VAWQLQRVVALQRDDIYPWRRVEKKRVCLIKCSWRRGGTQGKAAARRRSIARRANRRQSSGMGGEQTVAETMHWREIVSHRGAACHVGRVR